ncbi:MAG: hypothetical protein ABIX46_01425 [Burkholderiaceae bacterium]
MMSAYTPHPQADEARQRQTGKVFGGIAIAVLAAAAVLIGASVVRHAPAHADLLAAPRLGAIEPGSVMPMSFEPAATRGGDTRPGDSVPSESDRLLQTYAAHGG